MYQRVKKEKKAKEERKRALENTKKSVLKGGEGKPTVSMEKEVNEREKRKYAKNINKQKRKCLPTFEI